MPNFGYHLARAKGSAMRKAYRALLPRIVKQSVKQETSLSLDVFSYSGEAGLEEQVASIRSFIRHAGRPNRFVVVSDGTYSQKSIDLLKRSDRAVVVCEVNDRLPSGLPQPIYPYLTTHPTGKQLAVIMSLPDSLPALYTDSDVLFFEGAVNYLPLLTALAGSAYYLADCQLSADERLFRSDTERDNPVNTGFALLGKRLDWSVSIQRYLELEAEPMFFTNQTMAHLTMHHNCVQPLDTSKFILQLNDQFIYPDLYAGRGIAMRHYVNPVRHKFWTQLWT